MFSMRWLGRWPPSPLAFLINVTLSKQLWQNGSFKSRATWLVQQEGELELSPLTARKPLFWLPNGFQSYQNNTVCRHFSWLKRATWRGKGVPRGPWKKCFAAGHCVELLTECPCSVAHVFGSAVEEPLNRNEESLAKASVLVNQLFFVGHRPQCVGHCTANLKQILQCWRVGGRLLLIRDPVWLRSWEWVVDCWHLFSHPAWGCEVCIRNAWKCFLVSESGSRYCLARRGLGFRTGKGDGKKNPWWENYIINWPEILLLI